MLQVGARGRDREPGDQGRDHALQDPARGLQSLLRHQRGQDGRLPPGDRAAGRADRGAADPADQRRSLSPEEEAIRRGRRRGSRAMRRTKLFMYNDNQLRSREQTKLQIKTNEPKEQDRTEQNEMAEIK